MVARLAEAGTEVAGTLFDLCAQISTDAERGGIASPDDYARRFPKHAELVAQVVRELAAASASTRAEIEEAFLRVVERVLPPRAEARAIEVGATLAHYRLDELLGRGGQGVVYRAFDLRLSRRVALKVLSASTIASTEARARFRREAELASRIEHPNVCSVFEAGVVGDVAYIAMRFVEGATLATRIARTRTALEAGLAPLAPCAPASRADLAATLAFFERAARALHAAHELGIVHRDVKPGNVMVDAEGTPFVVDFGLARTIADDLDPLTGSDAILGTPDYLAPEQISPAVGRIDARTDVHALGAALCETLTLERPFRGATREALYRAILEAPAPDVRKLAPHLPREVALVVATALEKDPLRRYASALELADDLARIVRGEPIHARALPLALRAQRWIARHPARAVGAAALVALVAAAWYARDGQVRAAYLDQARRDDELLERMLDDSTRTPMQGAWPDWRAQARIGIDTLRASGLPVERGASPDEFARRLDAIEARRPELAGELRSALASAVAVLDQARLGWFGRRHAIDAWGTRDAFLRATARSFDAEGWDEVRARLASFVAACERDPWRARVWSAYDRWATSGVDELDRELAFPIDSSASGADLAWAAMLAYNARTDDLPTRLYREAHERSSRSPNTRFAARIGLGVAAHYTNDRAAALENLKYAIELRPESATPHLMLAWIHGELGDVERMSAAALRSTEIDPSNAVAQATLATAAGAASDWERMRSAAARAVELEPRSAYPLTLLGYAHWSLGADAESLDAYARALRLSPDDRGVWTAPVLNVGDAAHAERALELGDELEDSAGDSPLVRILRGRACEQLDRVDDALAEWEACARLAPESAMAQAWVSWARFQNGDLEGALAAARTACVLDPTLVNGHEMRAHVLEASQRPQEFLDAAIDGAAAFPRSQRLQAYTVRAALQCGDPELVREAARCAIGIWCDDVIGWNEVLDACVRAQDFEALAVASWFARGLFELRALAFDRLREACGADRLATYIDECARELVASPRDPTATRALALGAIAQGDHAFASALMQRALELQPARATSWLGVARASTARGDLEAARNELRCALECDPSHDDSWTLLLEIERRAGRPISALAVAAQHAIASGGTLAALRASFAELAWSAARTTRGG